MINTLEFFDKNDLLDEEELVYFLTCQRYRGDYLSAQKVHDILFLSYAWLKYYFPPVCKMVFPTPPQWAFTGFLFPDTVKELGMPRFDTPYRQPSSISFEVVNINMELKRLENGEYGEVIDLLMEQIETDWIAVEDDKLSKRITETYAWFVGLNQFQQDSILFNPIDEETLLAYLEEGENRMELFGFHLPPTLKSQLTLYTKEDELKGLFLESRSKRDPLFSIEELMLYIVEYGIEHQCPVSQMKLNKLLFLVNAKSIQEHGVMLVDGFEKGNYGPVHPAVNKYFGYFGSLLVDFIFPIFNVPEEELREALHNKTKHSLSISLPELDELIESFIHHEKWDLTRTCMNHPSWDNDKPLSGADSFKKYELEEIVEDIFSYKDFFKVTKN